MPKFGVSIYSISRKITQGEMTPREAIKWLCENGAEVIELVPFGIDMIANPALIEELLAEAKAYNVPIANYSVNANFLLLTEEEYIQEVERVKKHIDVAAQLGVPTIRIDSAGFRRPIHENTTEKFQQEIPIIVKAYEMLCDYAKQYGIMILLENHGFHANGAERVRQILTSVERENFSHQLDVGNYICVDDRPEVSVKKMIGFAKTIHMKDFYLRPAHRDPGGAVAFKCNNSWFNTVSGDYIRGSILAQGDLDMWCIIKTIKDSGFDGNIFVEYEGMEECEYGTKVSLENLKRIWNEV